MKHLPGAALCTAALFLALLPLPARAAEQEQVKIAIIDTGISTPAISPTSILPGFNYILPGDTQDKIGHGTAIAGILVGSQAAQLTGICPNAALVPLVYYSKDQSDQVVQGGTERTAQAIREAVDIYRCPIINISAGSTTDSTSLGQAVAYAQQQGALVVACAGNDNLENPSARYYPASYDTVLAVGSVDKDETVSSFSQRNDRVDILAPGTDLWVVNIRGNKYRAAGTSYSTAYVSGAAARLLEQTPGLTADQLRQILCASARDIGPTGYDIDSGWGILDMECALAWAMQGRFFRDVSPEDWHFRAVKAAVEAQLFGGTDAVHFSPNAPMTRAMLWTVLARHAGVETTAPAGTSWYDAGMAWAKAGGISDGTNPHGAMTREQLVAMLWRYATSPQAAADLAAFFDGEEVAGYAKSAMAWAVESGIVTGTDGALMPQNDSTRAQVAAMLQRFMAQGGKAGSVPPAL